MSFLEEMIDVYMKIPLIKTDIEFFWKEKGRHIMMGCSRFRGQKDGGGGPEAFVTAISPTSRSRDDAQSCPMNIA